MDIQVLLGFTIMTSLIISMMLCVFSMQQQVAKMEMDLESIQCQQAEVQESPMPSRLGVRRSQSEPAFESLFFRDAYPQEVWTPRLRHREKYA